MILPHPPDAVCLFEDDQADNLFPLTYLRPVFDLRCGAMTAKERIQRFFPDAKLYLQCRDYLAPLVHEQNPETPLNLPPPENTLYLNAAVILNEKTLAALASDPKATLVNKDRTVAFYGKLSTVRKEVDANLIAYPWDIIRFNVQTLAEDFRFAPKTHKGQCHSSVVMLNPANICTGEGSVIKPGVVLDAESGPIWIGRDVTIMPNAVIEGPCFIGDGTVIKIGAKIYGGTSIGPVCKIGGEVEGSVFQAYSNKQHDGFVGHSFIAEWCNLGADTNTSDLKNNYSVVKVIVNGKETDTGSRFVGLMMGDHAKSGINTMFNTGTVVGVCSNIFGAGFPPKFIPSFAWVNVPVMEEYHLNKAIEVARIVMQRRKITMSPTYENMLRLVFKMTEKERTLRCG